MPELSIIVAVYGVEKYIRQCMDSITAQLDDRVEVIVVNDCTKDHSIDICREYAAQSANIRIVEHAVNQGISAARNTGIREARGRYCWFVDGDDQLMPDGIAHILKALEFVSADTLIWSHIRFYEDSGTYQEHILPCEQVTIKEENKYQEMSRLCEITANRYGFEVWNKIFSVELIRTHDLQFPNGYYYGEDLVFLLNYMQYARRICVEDRCIYCYILHEASMMAGSKQKSRFSEMANNAVYIQKCLDTNRYSYAPASAILALGVQQAWDKNLYGSIQEYAQKEQLHRLCKKVLRSPFALVRLCGRRGGVVSWLSAQLVCQAISSKKKTYALVRRSLGRIMN